MQVQDECHSFFFGGGENFVITIVPLLVDRSWYKFTQMLSATISWTILQTRILGL